MRYSILGSALGFASLVLGAVNINNVQYCNQVNQVQYTNVGTSGTYSTPSLMSSDGTCNVEYTQKTYSGPLAPLNEQISMFFRGPLKLHNFAVYNVAPAQDYKVKKREPSINHRRHQHLHEKRKVKTEVVEEVITVTEYAPAPPATSSSSSAKPTGVAANAVDTSSYGSTGSKKGDWVRTGYYSAADQILEGLTFLSNKGSAISGTWTTCFGNSLAYLSADGKSASATSQILADGVQFGVNEEFSIWTNQTCDGSCGYSYASDPCYKGFDGVDKVFTFEFEMPTDTTNAGNIYGNSDMPAIWALNSLIGRTQQYPAQKEWSCWCTGCGEFDIWEVLYWDDPASQYMTSHLHSAQGASGNSGDGGGSTCDYFIRPTTAPMKGMVSFLGDGTITISTLDDSFDFPEYLSNAQVKTPLASPQLGSFAVPS